MVEVKQLPELYISVTQCVTSTRQIKSRINLDDSKSDVWKAMLPIFISEHRCPRCNMDNHLLHEDTGNR